MSRGTRTLTGLGLVVGGALLGMLSVTVLPWYRSSFNGILNDGTTVPRIRTSIAFYQGQPSSIQPLFDLGIAPAYFTWLGIAVLLAAAVAAVVSVGVSGMASRLAAALAAVLAVVGVVLTAFAIAYVRLDRSQFDRDVPAWGDFVAQSNVGAWAIVLAYLAVGVGALLAAGGRDALRTVLSDDADPAPTPEPTPEPTADAAPPATGSAVEPPQRPRENW